MADAHVVLGVTGSIAAYKAADLASRLVRCGIAVHVVMTRSATKLVGEATFRAITGRPVATDMFELTNPFAIEHVSLAEAADLMVVAPATANIIAKIATGIADDLLTCTALATTAPLLIAPAMHTAMWENAATRANVETLCTRGVCLVGPDEGRLASGGFGTGRLAPVPELLGEILRILGRDGDLAGRTIVVTAGGTREAIDPVRFLGNRSSGKMGFALAEAARDRGAEVQLIAGSTSAPLPRGVTIVRALSAAEMLSAVRSSVAQADVLIMAAAVADFVPATVSDGKIKKHDAGISIDLERSTDVLTAVDGPAVRVGFAAETDDLLENARRKLQSKRLDLVVANRIGEDVPFGADTNRAVLIGANAEEELPLLSKRELADRILDRVVALLGST